MRQYRLLSWLIAAAGISSVGLGHPALAAADEAVTYQINPAHTGSVTTPNLAPPLKKQWSVNLGGSISYPLIAGGRIFVTTATPDGAYGTKLYALDAQTGAIDWGPVSLTGTYYFSAAAYDSGKIFVVNEDGLLRSYDAATGTPGWSVQLPGQYAFSSAPTAVNGVVYVGGAGSGGTLYAVNETNGVVNWTASVENGDNSSPVVTDDGVYVSYSGPQTYKFDLSGSPLWHYNSGIEGGGGKTAAFYNGRLYARDSGFFVFDGSTGTLLGRSGSYGTKIPAFDSGREFSVDGSGNVEGIDLSTGNVLWTFSVGGPYNGAGGIVTAPLVVNGYVYVGTSGGYNTSGSLIALDPATGAVVWQDKVGANIAGPDEQNVSQPLTGMAAGEGLLVVPAGQMLVAYSQFVPSWTAKGIAAGADGKTRLLWTKADGTASFWSVDAKGNAVYSPSYGPFSGWTAEKVAAGANGSTDLFWTNTDGSASYWTISASGAVTYSPVYGPYLDWTPSDFTAADDGTLRLLWEKTDGAASFWTIPAGGGSPSYGPVYGPYAGWTATHIAAGSGGLTRLLWNNQDTSASFWTVPASGSPVYSSIYGPFTGWTANDIAVAHDGSTRLFWTNANASASTWNVDPQGNVSYSPVFGSYTGWTPLGYALAPDGSSRLLWDRSDSATSFWTLPEGGAPVYSPTVGPF